MTFIPVGHGALDERKGRSRICVHRDSVSGFIPSTFAALKSCQISTDNHAPHRMIVHASSTRGTSKGNLFQCAQTECAAGSLHRRGCGRGSVASQATSQCAKRRGISCAVQCARTEPHGTWIASRPVGWPCAGITRNSAPCSNQNAHFRTAVRR